MAKAPTEPREKTIPLVAVIRPKQTPAVYQKTTFLGYVLYLAAALLRARVDMLALLLHRTHRQSQPAMCEYQRGISDNP